MSLTCPRCNASVPQGSAFCSECGVPLRASSYAARTWPLAGGAAAQTTAPVMPAQRPAGRRVSSTAAPARKAAARQRRPWFRRKAVLIPLVMVLLLLTGIAGGAWYINTRFDALNRLSTPSAEISGGRLGGDEGLTIDTTAARESVDGTDANNPALADSPEGSVAILAMGVDARPGEPIDIDVRPDSLAVVYLDGREGSCRMLSIPRDTRTELPGYGQSKINHALAVGGIPYEISVVENLIGMDLDHYGLIDFAGVTQLVDAVGGITVENDSAFSQSGFDFPIGTLQLQGEEALAYSRFRHDEQGDFGRQERQQEVVRALLGEGASLDVVTAVPDLLSAVEGHVRTDLGPTQMIDLGQSFRSSCTSQTLETDRLTGAVATMYDDLLQMDLSFVTVEQLEIQQKVAWLRGEQG